jgi:N-acetylneuraminate synthase
MPELQLGKRLIGTGHPCYVVAEIGINHNGDVDIAKQLIDVAADAGCDAVKFQKRTPEVCTPRDQWDVVRETPWGTMRYIDYRHRLELDRDAYDQIDAHCRARGIPWFASCWDEDAVGFIDQFEPPAYKVASACLTDLELIDSAVATGRPVILSTGMSTPEEISAGVAHLKPGAGAIAHATSTYPCPAHELNLRGIQTLQARYADFPVGYSGHEVGLPTTVAAVALGAAFVERHVTLDRAMWGSDQAASVEPQGIARLVRDIRVIEDALGDGTKRVYDSELGPMARLRRVR